MLSEPLLAHRPEIGGAGAGRRPHPRDDADRHQHDADADDEKHMVVAAISRTAILTLGRLTVCALVHMASGLCSREQRDLPAELKLATCSSSPSNHHWPCSGCWRRSSSASHGIFALALELDRSSRRRGRSAARHDVAWHDPARMRMVMRFIDHERRGQHGGQPLDRRAAAPDGAR